MIAFSIPAGTPRPTTRSLEDGRGVIALSRVFAPWKGIPAGTPRPTTRSLEDRRGVIARSIPEGTPRPAPRASRRAAG